MGSDEIIDAGGVSREADGGDSTAVSGGDELGSYWRLVRRHYRWNLGVNVAQGGAALFSMAVFMPETVLAAYMTTLTSSKFLIGLPWALSLMYWSFPALFYSYWIQRKRRRKPITVFLQTPVRVAFSLMAVSALVATRWGAHWAIAVFLAGEAILVVTGGGAALAWQDLIGRVFPPERRAWSFGLRESFGQLSGFIASGLLFVYLHGRGASAGDYALPFVIGMLVYWVSIVLLAFVREPRWPGEAVEAGSWRRYYAETFSILRTDANFRTYVLIKCMMALMSIFNFGLFASYAINRFGISRALVAGVFSAVGLAARVFAAPVVGRMGDRHGFKRPLLAGLALVTLVLAAGLSLPLLGRYALAGFLAIYIINGVAGTTVWLADFNMIMEFGRIEDRPRYISVACLIASPVAFAAGAASGWFVDLFGYPPVIAAALVVALAVWGVVYFVLEEPRFAVTAAPARRAQ